MTALLLAIVACADSGGPAPSAPGRSPDTAADTDDRDTGGDDPDTAADTGDGEDTVDPDGDGLLGARLDPPIDPFPFLVENQRRAPREPVWLVGDPSVVWFFRDAGST